MAIKIIEALNFKMKETKTLEFFDEYDFENQNNQERTDVHQLLGGEIWYN